jgi:hypothetical protein
MDVPYTWKGYPRVFRTSGLPSIQSIKGLAFEMSIEKMSQLLDNEKRRLVYFEQCFSEIGRTKSY